MKKKKSHKSSRKSKVKKSKATPVVVIDLTSDHDDDDDHGEKQLKQETEVVEETETGSSSTIVSTNVGEQEVPQRTDECIVRQPIVAVEKLDSFDEDGVVKIVEQYEGKCHKTMYVEIRKNVELLQVNKSEESMGFQETDNTSNYWRHGPASYWYDLIGIPPDVDTEDYCQYLQKTDSLQEEKLDYEHTADCSETNPIKIEDFSEDSFHMVTQLNWESSVIWDGTNINNLEQSNKKLSADWSPSSVNMIEVNFSQSVENGPLSSLNNPPITTALIKDIVSSSSLSNQQDHDYDDGHHHRTNDTDTWDSNFAPVPNELVYSRWEDEIIWDLNKVKTLPRLPKLPIIDLLDEKMVTRFAVPEDVDPNVTTTTANGEQPATTTSLVNDKISQVNKSKILLSKAGIIDVIEEQEEESNPPLSPKKEDKDPYNISNDEFYQRIQVNKMCTAGNHYRHGTSVVELQAPYIPTCMGIEKLRNFHRPPLKRSSSKNLALPGSHPILPLTLHIKKTAKAREKERQDAGGGDFFFMRTPADLTGRNGELLLFEYSEEHPPLLSQVGMCSKIKNYYKRAAENGSGPPEKLYGETTYAHTSPFLGVMHPGQQIQTIENNMYRAPVYDHPVPKTDFLLILSQENYYIRDFDAIFTVGQQCPLEEVPVPNSARARNFVHNFLLIFIHRLFWKSRESPRQIRLDAVKRAFPQLSDTIIRNQLKQLADLRIINRVYWWILKSDRRLLSEEEMQAAISPERCCTYFSMIAAEQRLKDAGYGEKSIFCTPDNNNDDDSNHHKMEDEIKAAPWNTTKAYLRAISGKCVLDLTGPADPTGGSGEGFSYTVLSKKGKEEADEAETKSKRPVVAGTDADLRKLSLTKSKNILRSYGVPEKKMKKLSRKEAMNLVRTLYTEKAKAGEKGMDKFSRGSKKSHQRDRYRDDCQRIFDLQNRMLASHELLSSDEDDECSEEEADELSDIEEMGKDIESMLTEEKSSSQLRHEKEEQERLELVRTFMGDKQQGTTSKAKKNNNNEDEMSSTLNGLVDHRRILKIHRTFKSPDGKDYVRTEIVRNAAIIDIYMRIRTTKDEKWIRQFAHEKKQNQQQHRPVVKLGDKRGRGRPPGPSGKRKQENNVKGDKKNLKCGACGAMGHMKTNKVCPLYQKNDSPPVVVNMSSNKSMTMTDEEDEEDNVDNGTVEKVQVDGMKLHLSGNFLKQSQEMKLPPVLLKIPKFVETKRKRKRKRKRKAETSPHSSTQLGSRPEVVNLEIGRFQNKVMTNQLSDPEEDDDDPFLF